MALSRQAKGGAYAVIYSLVFVLILGAVNYLAKQYNKTYDFTENKLYSLSPQTVQILADLDTDVSLYYGDSGPGLAGAGEQLERYEMETSRLAVELIDIYREPLKAEELGITERTVIVESDGRRETARTLSEEDIANALIRLRKGEGRTVCFSAGHGEAANTDRDPRLGFSVAAEEIGAANYGTQVLTLATDGAVPAGCSLLVVAGPQNAFLDLEIEALDGYVMAGGRLMMLLDFDTAPELVALAARWGIAVTDEIILDFNPMSRLAGGGPVTPLATDYGFHPIGRPLDGTFSVFPVVRGVESGDVPDGWQIEEIVRSQASAFARAGFEEGTREFERDPNLEREGPISMGVAATFSVAPTPDADSAESDDAGEEVESRVVVFGTSNFARNGTLRAGANLDLFLNALNWLSSDEDLISIRPKDPENTPLNMTQGDVWRIFLVTMLLIPALITIVGFRVWWMRR